MLYGIDQATAPGDRGCGERLLIRFVGCRTDNQHGQAPCHRSGAATVSSGLQPLNSHRGRVPGAAMREKVIELRRNRSDQRPSFPGDKEENAG